MPCTKRPFNSPEEANKQLRIWQRNGRRAELDQAHVYKADCTHSGHRGKFHVGRKHDPMKPLRGRPIKARYQADTSADVLEELDDLFHHQQMRIMGMLDKVDRSRRRRFVRDDDGPLNMPESQTLGPGGDELDVRNK